MRCSQFRLISFSPTFRFFDENNHLDLKIASHPSATQANKTQRFKELNGGLSPCPRCWARVRTRMVEVLDWVVEVGSSALIQRDEPSRCITKNRDS